MAYVIGERPGIVAAAIHNDGITSHECLVEYISSLVGTIDAEGDRTNSTIIICGMIVVSVTDAMIESGREKTENGGERSNER